MVLIRLIILFGLDPPTRFLFGASVGLHAKESKTEKAL